MTLLLSITLVLLLFICLMQSKQNLERNKQLAYVTHKLDEIRTSQSAETVMVFTGDAQLRELLRAINDLIEEHNQVTANYQRTELSMRKMLANISHDLKTPLTVIHGYVETILAGKGSANDRERLEKVQTKTIEIIELINKFFDLAKLEAGDQNLTFKKVAVNELCKNRILSYFDLIQNEKLQVEIEIPSQPFYVLADEKALDRILDNLISNAIRYGKDGKMVGLRLYHDDAYVSIKVWDRGKGISDKDREKVFERLYTLEDSRNKQYQGSGLGLTITKRLTERLNGHIHLESRPYDRTSFIVKLKRITG